MSRITFMILLLVALIVPSAQAQDKPLIVLSTAYVAATLFDAETTIAGLNKGLYEANPLAKPVIRFGRPGLYAISMLSSVAVIGGTVELKRRGVDWWWVPITAVTAFRIGVGVHNLSLTLRF